MQERREEIYEFGAFRLNVTERRLETSGQRVALSEKAFETLCILVRNAGRLVSKSDLLGQVWPDAIVEENNLNKSIYAIRQALGEKSGGIQFIETVKKHGFRFVASVREAAPDRDSDAAPEASTTGPAQGSRPARRSGAFFKPAAFLVMIAAIVSVGAWYAVSGPWDSRIPILEAPFAVEKLSTNGKVYHAVISRDGKNVVYTDINPNDNSSIWLTQLETGNNVEVVPPNEHANFGIALSPDGSYIYFVRGPRFSDIPPDIYRVSVFGGVPQKLISGAQGWIRISPDGSRISFVRCDYGDEDFCSLYMADAATGRNEKLLVRQGAPMRIGDNEFSPDGKFVAYATGTNNDLENGFGISTVDIATGERKDLLTEKFFDVRGIAWLPDQKSLIFSASKSQWKNVSIWRVTLPTGQVEMITRNSETYSDLSLNDDATRIVATQFRESFRARVSDLQTATNGFVLQDAITPSFGSDGKIVFASTMSGNEDIWSVSQDGDGRRQLTNDASDDGWPVVSPVDGSIFFSSNRTGQMLLWRMHADGSDQQPITRSVGGFPRLVSPDGKWLYFQHFVDRRLWRISLHDGTAQLVIDNAPLFFSLSRDAAFAAFREELGTERFIALASIRSGQVERRFKLADQSARVVEIGFSSDGSGIYYVLIDGDNKKEALWYQSLQANEGGVRVAELGNREGSHGFDVSPDGTRFVLSQGGPLHNAVLLKGLK